MADARVHEIIANQNIQDLRDRKKRRVRRRRTDYEEDDDEDTIML